MKHFCNGIYSGIPICCSFFFSKCSMSQCNNSIAYDVLLERGFEIEMDKDVYGFRFLNEQQKLDTNEHLVQYVRCPNCFKKKKHKPIKSNGVLF